MLVSGWGGGARRLVARYIGQDMKKAGRPTSTVETFADGSSLVVFMDLSTAT